MTRRLFKGKVTIMRLTELKALDRLAKSDKTYDFLQHVFVSGEYVYACTPYIVVEILAKELQDNCANVQFAAVDMDKAIACNDNLRYVKLDECLTVDDYAKWNKWEPDYFSRFFNTKLQHGNRYDPKYLIKIFQIFKAFDVDVSFLYYTQNNLMTYEGFSENYEIRAFLMSIK